MPHQDLTLLLSREEISQGVKRLAEEIRNDYQGKYPLLVGVLKGSFVFLADLVREIDIPLTVDFIQAQSYEATSSTGKVQVSLGKGIPVTGRHVLLVEDIVDTGLTVTRILGRLREEAPASLKLCSLLDKPSRRRESIKIDYLGFTVPDVFVVGYGLDLYQQHRYFADIYTLSKA